MTFSQSNTIKTIKEDLIKEVEKAFEEVLTDGRTPKGGAVVFLNKNADLFVSTTEDDEYDQILKWRDFSNEVMVTDVDILSKALPRFKKLVADMEKAISQSE